MKVQIAYIGHDVLIPDLTLKLTRCSTIGGLITLLRADVTCSF